MAIWRIILLITGIIALLITFVSFFWTMYKKRKLIQKYSFNLENEDSTALMTLGNQISDLKSEIWLIESLEFVINKINKENFKKNLFLESDGLVACLSQKNIENSQNMVSINYLDENRINENAEKLNISGLNFVSFYEPFFDFILISVKIEPKSILEFLEILKTDGVLIWKYTKKHRQLILKFLKSKKIVFDEYFYYDFLIITKK